MMGLSRPLHQVNYDLEEIKALVGSRGWAIVKEVLEREANRATDVITSDASTTKEQLDFYRASLRSIRLMLTLPEQISQMLSAEYELAKKTQIPDEKEEQQ